MRRSLRKPDGRWGPSRHRFVARWARCVKVCSSTRRPVPQLLSVEVRMNSPTDENLPADLVDAMLADVAGAEIDGSVGARIKARVLDRIGAKATRPVESRAGFIDVLAEAGWQVLAPGVEMKVLFE